MIPYKRAGLINGLEEGVDGLALVNAINSLLARLHPAQDVNSTSKPLARERHAQPHTILGNLVYHELNLRFPTNIFRIVSNVCIFPFPKLLKLLEDIQHCRRHLYIILTSITIILFFPFVYIFRKHDIGIPYGFCRFDSHLFLIGSGLPGGWWVGVLFFSVLFLLILSFLLLSNSSREGDG